MSTTEQQSPALPVGLTLDRGFALLRRHPRALLLPQLVLNVLPLLIGAVLVVIGIVLIGDVRTHTEIVRVSTFLGDSQLERREVADYTGGQTAVLVVLITLGAIAFTWFLLAALVSVVRGADRALEGREHLPLRPAVRDALRATPKLFGFGIVYYLGLVVVLLGLAVVVVIVAEVAGALAALVGLAAVLVLVWLVVRTFLWPFVHLSEGTGFASFGRAWRLTRGRFWALFGVAVLVAIVVAVVYFVVSFVLQLVVIGALSISDEVGIVALIPYVVFSVIFSLVFTAGYIAPFAVAYRTLAGRDTAELWRAAEQMRAGAPGGPDVARPAPEPGVRRWDASEEPIEDRGSGAADAGTSGGESPGPGLGGGLWSGAAR